MKRILQYLSQDDSPLFRFVSVQQITLKEKSQRHQAVKRYPSRDVDLWKNRTPLISDDITDLPKTKIQNRILIAGRTVKSAKCNLRLIDGRESQKNDKVGLVGC
ncbi:hypothetical protein LOAG_01668 [Loa loa]|uniref:Uncharacterized protein n=1 Tax=Loa loa TaxID=7209 RepID=A0A1S0U941_LOALO|nr:hypothetical protein LOAG_01668 [Loa loa]EFO26814.1 hypothetical protein LOAG_01668 [Loa loa]